MSSTLYPTAFADVADDRHLANQLVGIDESKQRVEGDEILATVAVACDRATEEKLLAVLINSGFLPFQYKSSSIIHHGPMADAEERETAANNFIEQLDSLDAQWRGIISRDASDGVKTTAAAQVAKKSITMRESRDPHLILHDGAHEASGYGDLFSRQAASTFDESFQEYVCQVEVLFHPGGDVLYPQIIAADIIAGHLSSALSRADGAEVIALNQVERYDDSWNDPADDSLPVETVSPDGVDTDSAHSCASSWLRGRRGAMDAATNEGLRQHLGRLSNETTRSYLEDVVQ